MVCDYYNLKAYILLVMRKALNIEMKWVCIKSLRLLICTYHCLRELKYVASYFRFIIHAFLTFFQQQNG